MKKTVLFLIAFPLLSACGKQPAAPGAELWFNNANLVKSIQLSDAVGAHGAIATGNIDLNAPNQNNQTALQYAILTTQNPGVIAALAAAPGADLQNALNLAAAQNPNEEVLLALLISGARPADAYALLDAAYKNTNILVPNMVGRLIQKTAWDKSPDFLEALKSGDVAALARLLPFTDISAAAADGQTPLQIAINGLNPQIVQILVDYGANVERYINEQQKVTPLLYAAASRPPEIIEALLKAGANPNAADTAGMTPLISAIKLHPEPAKTAALLLRAGADVNAADSNGLSALHHAALAAKDDAIIKTLLAAGAALEAKDKKGFTPLMLAVAYNGEAAITNALLLARADTNAVNIDGLTPIMAASAFGASEGALKALISHGGDVNTPNRQGQTPLMLAAANNPNAQITQALLAAGAAAGDVPALVKLAQNNKNSEVTGIIKTLLPPEPVDLTAQNSASRRAWYNSSAFRSAVQAGDNKALRAALKKGVIPKGFYAVGSTSVSALMFAIAHTNKADVIMTLIEAGAEVAAKNPSGDSALSVAALLSKNPEIINILYRSGAPLDAPDAAGNTPLMIAAANNPDESIIHAFLNLGASTQEKAALMQAAAKNKNPKIKEILQQAQ